jgi:hypothetical protein
MAARAVTERNTLIEQRDKATLGVTINSKYQDELMLELVRPVVAAELTRRIGEIEADLRQWGVEVPVA